jgi:uncharacterized membrane protein YoaT (DUF817 family)
MWSVVSKIAAVLIAIAYLVIAVVNANGISREDRLGLMCLATALLVPLALIWFPDDIGSFTGSIGRGGQIDAETPPALVSFMGWFLLVGFPVILYLLTNAH